MNRLACVLLFWACALAALGSVLLMIWPLDEGDHDLRTFAQVEALLAVAFAVASRR